MAKAKSIRKRIQSDRGPAGCLGFVVALPALAIVAGILWAFAYSLQHHEEAGDLILSAVILFFALMFWLVAQWSYGSARAAMTPQRIQVMWLRRFQSEKGDAFRPSRVIDRLSRHGISAITLQDRDVKLSFEQRRNRLAPVFWFFFAPIAIVLGIASVTQYQKVQTDIANQQIEYSQNIAEALVQAFVQGLVNGLAVVFVILVFVLAFMATTLLILAIAALAGPVGALLSSKRDDFRRLPRLMERIRRGKRPKGAQVLRISNEDWQNAVRASLAVADVAIIDLSSVTDNIAWEISEAVKACSANSLVFIAGAGDVDRALAPQAAQIVQKALGRSPRRDEIIVYPERQGRDAKAFARNLREAIYAAYDRRHTA